MTFIGSKGVSAPHLNEASNIDYPETYQKILDNLTIMVSKSKLIHGDLSPYNILLFRDEPYFIDVSQTVLFDHPLVSKLLMRDIENLNKFFSSRGFTIVPSKDIFSSLKQFLVVGKPVDKYGRKYRRNAKYKR